jgi:hypothetical protein
MLKQGAAGENSDISRDWQYLQTKGLQQSGEIINRAEVAWKLKAAAIDQESQLPQRDVGDGQLTRLPTFLQGCGGTRTEARWSIGPEQGDGGVTNDPHHHSTPQPSSLGPHHQGSRDQADLAATGGHLRQGPALETGRACSTWGRPSITRGALPAIRPVVIPSRSGMPWRADLERRVPRAGPFGLQVRAARAVADRERQPGNRSVGSWAAPLTRLILAQVVKDVRAPGCRRWLAVKATRWLMLAQAASIRSR